MPYSIMMDAGHGEHRLRQFKKKSVYPNRRSNECCFITPPVCF